MPAARMLGWDGRVHSCGNMVFIHGNTLRNNRQAQHEPQGLRVESMELLSQSEVQKHSVRASDLGRT